MDTLGLWVLELFAMYATDGRTDRQIDDGRTKATLIVPFFMGGRLTIRQFEPTVLLDVAQIQSCNVIIITSYQLTAEKMNSTTMN